MSSSSLNIPRQDNEALLLLPTMVFGNLRNTFSSRRRRGVSVALSEIPVVRYEETPEPAPAPTLATCPSFREIRLPSVPHHKPMTMTNLLAIGTISDTNLASVTHVAESSSTTTSSTSNASTPSDDMINLQRKLASMVIKRKPVGQADADPRPTPYVPSFDPQVPRYDASLHLNARATLIKRYQSKFTLDFEIPEGVNPRDYDFIWVKKGELEKKVLEDIIWVR
jgi:hypothetical protein